MMPRAGALRRLYPCEGVPTISSVGTTTKTNDGNCSDVDVQLSTSLTISGSLPTGAKVQVRSYFGTSPTPSYSGWGDWSGFTPNTDTYVQNVGLYSGTSNGNPSNTYYYNVQFRIVGTDGTTVCDGDGPFPTQWSGTLWDCTA